jgi:hypothetical protein
MKNANQTVSRRNVIRRARRTLSRRGQMLIVNRSQQWTENGEFWICDGGAIARGCYIYGYHSIEDMIDDLSLLGEGEELEQTEG